MRRPEPARSRMIFSSFQRTDGATIRVGRGGYFQHSNMNVIGKLWREGDTLHYQGNVGEPGVLMQPWVMDPRNLKLKTNPKTYIREGDPCRDVDYENMVSKIRH